ncbi:MAG: imidazole glycerol phosphate synthase subunit HisH [Candidatus Gracilibacteria bacterium]|jgi:glutamine amidotransferase|nr:imidazole glycerol phosphate synthase subunit HisH [Candidatus Gracilibacteria bacterium]
MIYVIKYAGGNLQSIFNALNKIGADFKASHDPEELEKATKIIFPGVGHAKSALDDLKEKKLDIFLKNTKKPTLGICLGMQIMLEYSEESNKNCLGIINGKVKKFTPQKNVPIPHMGFNEIRFDPNISIFKGLSQNFDAYFVHSYYAESDSKIATTHYAGVDFTSAIHKDNFFGVQFHPEKSGEKGLQILKNFYEL